MKKFWGWIVVILHNNMDEFNTIESESEATQSCPTLCDPMDSSLHQAPPSMGFSRQECWSGLPFPSPGNLPNPGVQTVGTLPFEDLEVDFTEVKPYRGCKYLLVVVCACSRWAEAYPTCTERAWGVAKPLLRDIIPRYGLPLSIGSGNGPPFVTEIIQVTGNQMEASIAYRPQSSGKVERMNQTLKTTLAKLCQETQFSWVDTLPVVLLWAWCTLRSSCYSPFEILYRRTPPGDRKT